MTEEKFSERYGYKSEESALIYENAPEQIRVGLREVLEICGYKTPSNQRTIVCKALRRMPDENNWTDYPNVDFEVTELINGLIWYNFYNLCEKLSKRIGGNFEDNLNKLFREENIGYQIKEGKIDKLGTADFRKITEQAMLILSSPRFEVPSKQYSKAMNFRNSLPPDYPNAVKEAVNSVEGILQIVAKMPGVAMPAILTGLNPQLPSGLKKLYDGLYGYGSGSEGARHSGVGGHVPTAEEAEFIIHSCSAAIRYIVHKYG
jgi:hypothetical protein